MIFVGIAVEVCISLICIYIYLYKDKNKKEKSIWMNIFHQLGKSTKHQLGKSTKHFDSVLKNKNKERREMKNMFALYS